MKKQIADRNCFVNDGSRIYCPQHLLLRSISFSWCHERDLCQLWYRKMQNQWCCMVTCQDKWGQCQCLALWKLELQRMTPCSKHYTLKYHWFWEHIGLHQFELVKIDTNNQLGDLFTKGLASIKFSNLQRSLWAGNPLSLSRGRVAYDSPARTDPLMRSWSYSSHTTHFFDMSEISLEFWHLIPLCFLA